MKAIIFFIVSLIFTFCLGGCYTQIYTEKYEVNNYPPPPPPPIPRPKDPEPITRPYVSPVDKEPSYGNRDPLIRNGGGRNPGGRTDKEKSSDVTEVKAPPIKKTERGGIR